MLQICDYLFHFVQYIIYLFIYFFFFDRMTICICVCCFTNLAHSNFIIIILKIILLKQSVSQSNNSGWRERFSLIINAAPASINLQNKERLKNIHNSHHTHKSVEKLNLEEVTVRISRIKVVSEKDYLPNWLA